MWESSFSVAPLFAVVLPRCVCHTYLLPSLSRSYVFDIKAVRKITKGTEKPVYPSDQSGKLSRRQWLTAHRGWHKAPLLGEMSSAAAEIELNCWEGDAGGAQVVERGTAQGQSAPRSFWAYLLTWRCCLGMGKLRQRSGAALSRQLWAV